MDDAEEFVSYSFKPQMRTLGPRFGRQLNEIRTLLQGIDGSRAMRELTETGRLVLTLSSGEAVLAPEDLLIETAQKSGFVSERDGECTVVLDTRLTPELIDEGFVREIVSKVQTMRKEAGFEVTDRIRLSCEGSAVIARIFAGYEKELSREVLAQEVTCGKASGSTKAWNLNGEDVVLGVERL